MRPEDRADAFAEMPGRMPIAWIEHIWTARRPQSASSSERGEVAIPAQIEGGFGDDDSLRSRFFG